MLPNVFDNILTLIGNTPVVRLRSFDTGLCELYVKLESQNPGGSIKDRVALSMIQIAEQEGKIRPGATLVEATAGNTGLGLALVAAQKGYKLVLVIPDKMSKEKVFHLRAMGAEIVTTRSDVTKGHPEYYQDLAESIAKRTSGYYINQFGNHSNPLAHETTTGPEIWEQMGKQLDAVVCGVGSGGTITGLSRYFQNVSPQTEMILADPKGSILTHFVETGEILSESGSWAVEGIGEDFIPSIADLSRVKKAYTVSDEESFELARALLLKEGILAGSSSGTLLGAALRYCREQTSTKRVLTFICDSGNKYLSKMFNDYWMLDHGYLSRAKVGNLTDLISRRHEEGATVVVGPSDTVNTAISRMNIHEISQLPVVDGDRIVGILDESDLLMALRKDIAELKRPVSEVMSHRLETLPPEAPVEFLIPIFEKGLVAIIESEGKFLGLVTRMDLISYLRKKVFE